MELAYLSSDVGIIEAVLVGTPLEFLCDHVSPKSLINKLRGRETQSKSSRTPGSKPSVVNARPACLVIG